MARKGHAITRREIVTSIGLGFGALTGPALGTMRPNGGDAETELWVRWTRFEALLAAHANAAEEYSRREHDFFRRRPPVPDVLRSERSGGCLLSRLPAHVDLWTSALLRQRVEEMRRQSPDEESSVPAHAIAAAEELLSVAEAYEADCARVAAESGYPLWEERQNALASELDQIAERICAAPATSRVGLAVKVRVLKLWAAPHWWDPDEAWPERAVAQLLDLLTTASAPESSTSSRKR